MQIQRIKQHLLHEEVVEVVLDELYISYTELLHLCEQKRLHDELSESHELFEDNQQYLLRIDQHEYLLK